MTEPTTPPAPHSGLLRRAADRTPDPATAALLRTLADAADHRTDATVGLMGTVLHPAVTLARTILDTAAAPTTAACPECGDAGACNGGPCPLTPPVDTDLRDRIRRAICEASGFTWLPDELMEPDEYGEHADAVLAVLPAPTAPAAVDQPADRRDRYAAAMALRDGHPKWPVQYEDDERDYLRRADAVMAVADTEQAALRAEVEGLDEALRGAISASEKDGARLRAEVEQLRTDRATGFELRGDEAIRAATLREARDAARAESQRLGTEMSGDAAYGARAAAKVISRLADEAQQPETEAPRRPGPDDVQVWPLARVLTEVRCGSQDWSWDEEWADLERRHAASGYLDRLEQEIKANGITLPVLIGSDGRLWDGHHRLRIAVRLGIGYVPVEVTPREPTPAPSEEPTP